MGLGGLADVIAVGAIIGILTVMFTFMLGVTRVWFSMSRDGLLPKWFAKTHPSPARADPGHLDRRASPPRRSPGFLPIGEAAELTNIGILLAFVVVCVAVIVLRYRRPDLPRTFRTPGHAGGAGRSAWCFSIWLITFLQWQTWVRFAVWFLIGLVIYFAYSRHRSLLARPPAADADARDAGAADTGAS